VNEGEPIGTLSILVLLEGLLNNVGVKKFILCQIRTMQHICEVGEREKGLLYEEVGVRSK
jgi:hypothetical protein